MLLEPAARYDLTDVTYHLNDLDLIGDIPVHLATSTARNEDVNEQVISVTLRYSMSTSSEWSNSHGFTQGVSMSVKAGIPMFVENEWTISQEMNFDYGYGGSYTETVEMR